MEGLREWNTSSITSRQDCEKIKIRSAEWEQNERTQYEGKTNANAAHCLHDDGASITIDNHLVLELSSIAEATLSRS